MKRFHFPLRPVAIVRADREMRAREALAAALRARRLAEEELAAAQGRVGELAGVIAAGRVGSYRGADQANFLRAYRCECALAAEKAKQLAAAQAEAAARRDACIEANRQLKVVTRLEDKARAAHRAELLRLEQQLIDESAGYGALRRRLSP